MYWTCGNVLRKGVLKACDEVWGKTKGRRDQGDTWWDKDVKEVIVRVSKRRTEANKVRFKNMKNWAKKVVMKAMREVAEKELR